MIIGQFMNTKPWQALDWGVFTLACPCTARANVICSNLHHVSILKNFTGTCLNVDTAGVATTESTGQLGIG